MIVEFVAVGTELLLGQIVNTNAAFVARQCASLGLNMYHQTVVGDNVARILHVLDIASRRAQVVVCSGGLGPTRDDVTLEALATWTQRETITDPQALQHLHNVSHQRASSPEASYWRQAQTLKGGHPLYNDVGLAVGTAVLHEGVYYVLLPGPPRELQAMWHRTVVPWMQQHFPHVDTLYSFPISCAGIGEAAVARGLDDLIVSQSDPTIATYAKVGEVLIRVTTRAPSPQLAHAQVQEVKQEIVQRLSPYIYAFEDISLAEAIIARLRQRHETVAVAESCTGGACGHRFTTVDGSSQAFRGGIICYTDEAKAQWLDVPWALLQGAEAPGAISATVAGVLAENVATKWQTDYGISFTGVAGSEAVGTHPSGHTFIGVYQKGSPPVAYELQLTSDRAGNQERAVQEGLYRLWCMLHPSEMPSS